MNNEKKALRDWYSLSSNARLKEVIDLTKQGYTAKEISSMYNIKKKNAIKEYMYNKGFRLYNGRFTRIEELREIQRKEEEDRKQKEAERRRKRELREERKIKEEEPKVNSSNILSQIDFKELAYKLSKEEYFREILGLTPKPTYTEQEQEIKDIEDKVRALGNIILLNELNEKKVILTSMRLTEEIYIQFKELWRNKYKMYKQYDLLSIALLEFINKYS